MKYCPACETRFDDEVMRFCTKDGTPLIDEAEPQFTALPSEVDEQPMETVVADDEDEAGEVTVVRRNVPVPPPGIDDDDFSDAVERPSERIVVPMAPEPVIDPIRNRSAAVYYPPPRQNTFKVIVLTVIGTLFVLGVGALLFALLQRDRSNVNNINLNANLNANQNTNYGIDSNFNFNMNAGGSMPANISTNLNTNANLRTPTPTPSPTATPRPSPSVTPTPDIEISPSNTRPAATPDTGRPRTTPTPAASPTMTRSTPRPTPHSTPDN